MVFSFMGGKLTLEHISSLMFVHKIHQCPERTLIKKKRKIFLVYKEIQMGSVAKSYMRKGFLRYEEMRKYLVIYMRRPLVFYDFATAPIRIYSYMRTILFSFFYQCLEPYFFSRGWS